MTCQRRRVLVLQRRIAERRALGTRCTGSVGCSKRSITITHANEAIGIAHGHGGKAAGMLSANSFRLETDGRLPILM